MQHNAIHIRKATVKDIQNIMMIQLRGYAAEYLEDIEILQAIVEQNMSYVAIDIDTKLIIGYVLIHSIESSTQPPPLNCHVNQCKSDNYFIHDVCVDPKMQGMGYGTRLWKYALMDIRIAKQAQVTCVSLPMSVMYWKHNGFEECPCDHNIIQTYAKDAKYLVLKTFTL